MDHESGPWSTRQRLASRLGELERYSSTSLLLADGGALAVAVAEADVGHAQTDQVALGDKSRHGPLVGQLCPTKTYSVTLPPPLSERDRPWEWCRMISENTSTLR